MRKSNLMRPLKGIVPPMITPLLDRDTLDVEGLEKLIEHILGGGVHGLFILGTTGEAPSLSYDLRYELIKRTSKQVNGRVPLLVGVTDTSFSESIKLARFSAEQGADAAVLAPPYYFSQGQPELIEYIGHVTKELPLPLFLYNMPGCTKVHMDPETVMILSEYPRIIGLKDSSCDMMYFHKIRAMLKQNPEFAVLLGPEELLAESVLLGADGGVNGGANMFPSLYVALYNAAVKKDIDTVVELHKKVVQISMTIYSTGRYGSSVLKGIKCALGLMGVCNDFISEPFHRFRDPEREIIRKFLSEIKIDV
ncbi:putative 2-keto-3-deoxy-galactonate aldolase YagE [Limihaloglobus sulfuriphilus]|uniref:Putative 2-keto-3-deoxy-galactonate aldolase YagE n=1 Tax=Limihaloglobus sulfuriphilus TaxID=1851148 RepID=A0A1Q2MES3_9BACT|nr:dihydrodipicolinate synthase family protein [Limihaloglobus sulfuriphilus]AQQ71154.1 putative 2-keto-3-deoxy-galactonate aldolase YagE [Limihaloglobus sulfuriphilus]